MATNKPDNPTDRKIAIMDLYDSGLFLGPCSVEEMQKRIGCTSQGVTRSLRDLGFTIATRRVCGTPWTAPPEEIARACMQGPPRKEWEYVTKENTPPDDESEDGV